MICVICVTLSSESSDLCKRQKICVRNKETLSYSCIRRIFGSKSFLLGKCKLPFACLMRHAKLRTFLIHHTSFNFKKLHFAYKHITALRDSRKLLHTVDLNCLLGLPTYCLNDVINV